MIRVEKRLHRDQPQCFAEYRIRTGMWNKRFFRPRGLRRMGKEQKKKVLLIKDKKKS